MKEKQAKKYTEQFARKLARCDVSSFLGVARILQVNIHTDCAQTSDSSFEVKNDEPKIRESCDFELRPFEEVFGDIIEKYDSLARKQRKDLLKIVQAAGER